MTAQGAERRAQVAMRMNPSWEGFGVGLIEPGPGLRDVVVPLNR